MGPGCQFLELPVLIDLTKIATLLDCGAIPNIISSGMVELLLLLASIRPLLMVTMSNILVVRTERYVTVPLLFGPSSQLISFLILPDLSTPIILGMRFLEIANPMVDLVNKLVAWRDNGGKNVLRGNKWSNSGPVQLVLLEAFYLCMWDSDCAGSWKVWIKPQGLLGLVNIAKAQEEELIDPKVSAVMEKYHGLFNAPELMPPTRAIAHLIVLFDKAALPSKQH